tara:strand:- start:155 stop:298 length:144 start_codon:yes stop_codon:yes gene_type:complete
VTPIPPFGPFIKILGQALWLGWLMIGKDSFDHEKVNDFNVLVFFALV